jgi:hypothetical protein
MLTSSIRTSPGFGLALRIEDVATTNFDKVLGALTAHSSRSLSTSTEAKQVDVWRETWGWLNEAVAHLLATNPSASTWVLCLEYSIPRRSGRIDAVLLAGDLVFVIEFKKTSADSSALRQAEDYALELLDFHEPSHDRALFSHRMCGRGNDGPGSTRSEVWRRDDEHLLAQRARFDAAALAHDSSLRGARPDRLRCMVGWRVSTDPNDHRGR